MNLVKISLFLFGTILMFLGSWSPALAVEIPNFPSCTTPSGTVKASYQHGVHGIPGDQGQYVGRDIVFRVFASTLIQCFCAATGSGIQTNWWKKDSLTEDQIDQLAKLDWIYIPDGSAWGLDPVPYLAQNSSFNCGGSGGFSPSGPGPAPVCDSAKPGTPILTSIIRSGSTAKLTWTAVANATHYTIGYGLKTNDYIYGVPDTGNVTTYTIGSLDPTRQYYFAVRAVNSCMPGDFATPTAIGGQVLGLATTGDSVLIYSLVILGVLLLALSWASRKRQNRA